MFDRKVCHSAASTAPGFLALAELAAQSYGPKGAPAISMSACLQEGSGLPTEAKPAAEAIAPLLKGRGNGVKTALLLAFPVAGCGLGKAELEAGFGKALPCAMSVS